MRLGRIAAAGLAWFGVVATVPAMAEPAELRIVRTAAIADLPLVVVERKQLIEAAAKAKGLGGIAVRWLDPPAGGGLEAVRRGEADIAVAETGAFLIARDRALGTPGEVAALAAVSRAPYVLVSRDPTVRTIRDFTKHDRIAVPGKTALPALMLEMAAATEWGEAEFTRLDRFTVIRSDPEAAFQLRSGGGEVTAHFSRSPYADDELGNRGLNRVMDSFDIAGPHSDELVVAPAAWCAANPRVAAAVLAALQEADRFIKDNSGAAAELYVAATKDRVVSVEDLSDMIGDPDAAYDAAPAGLARLARFLAATRRLAHPQGAWQENFCGAARDLPGN